VIEDLCNVYYGWLCGALAAQVALAGITTWKERVWGR
jgi:hypothetical protein